MDGLIKRGPGRPRKEYQQKEYPMTEQVKAPETEKLFPVKLLRNYRPAPGYEIIGHYRAAVTAKTAGGNMVEISPAAFIHGEQSPPVKAGTGFANKMWKGTLLRLPVEEAKRAINLRIAERADEIRG